MTRDVVLVPGLWMPAVSMGAIGTRLAAAGYRPHLFTHPARAPMEANVERLRRFAHEALDGAPAHYVGHSLGGVLVYETLERHRELAAAGALLIGAPVRGSLAGRRYSRLGLARWMMGSAQARWAEREAAWRRAEPLGVIAGTLPFGLGRALAGGLPGANDGVVRVEETAVQGMAAMARVPVGHSLLILSRRVQRLIERFLAAGRFE